MKFTFYGDPRTKKNSARILQGRGGRRFVAPSAAFEDYQTRMSMADTRPA